MDLMLLRGAHPIHRRFSEHIRTTNYEITDPLSRDQFLPFKVYNLLKNSLSLPSGYDHILCESCYYFPAIKRRFGLLGDTKIINFSCGPLYYHLTSGRIKGLERNVLVDLLKEVDGHLVFGEYGVELARRLSVSKPMRKVYPFVIDSVRKELEKIEPDLSASHIVVVATQDPYCKGLDIIFEAFGRVLESHEAHLTIVTRMDPKAIRSVRSFQSKNVEIIENAKDISIPLSKASLYLQPSRGDIFPIACLEAMTAGIPAIVSEETGTKEIVSEVDGSMVIPPDPKKLADSILGYFDKSHKEKKALSLASREAASIFREETQLERFKKEFSALKREL